MALGAISGGIFIKKGRRITIIYGSILGLIGVFMTLIL
jgi:hypothetical protein